MKFRHLLTGTILTISILAATAVTAFAAVSKGRFETVDSNVISGWAYNSDSPDHALNVLITITNKNTGEEVFSRRMSAGEYREDLYKDNKGNGCHGFTIDIDWDAYPEGVYLVEGAVGDRSFSNPRTYANGNSQTGTSAPGSQALIPLRVFKTTAYCPCRACSGLGTPHMHRGHCHGRTHHRSGSQGDPLWLQGHDQRRGVHGRGPRRSCEGQPH